MIGGDGVFLLGYYGLQLLSVEYMCIKLRLFLECLFIWGNKYFIGKIEFVDDEQLFLIFFCQFIFLYVINMYIVSLFFYFEVYIFFCIICCRDIDFLYQ